MTPAGTTAMTRELTTGADLGWGSKIGRHAMGRIGREPSTHDPLPDDMLPPRTGIRTS
jgi:hypothetical protein